ncbi:MAG TPA: FAD-dependent monooxygenase, partial [Gammaproteobacteria bacterium]|nr:FAD-dependent monooxygenase [Gammaproteobacteria bacterium]
DLQKDKANIIIEKEGQNIALSANLVLAADGTHSTVRSLLNFETDTTDYQQKAIVAPVTLQRNHHHIAYERFLNDGAIAMLPLKNETPACAMIWTAANNQIDNLMSLSDSEFLKILQKQFGYRLGKLINIEQRATFPLHFIHVKNPIKDNVILIGNAAHTIHPVAAQGLNLALYEIAHITQVLLENHKEEQPLIKGLSEKLPKLQPKTNLMFSHYLNPLFSSNWFAINAAKQAGMMILDLCPPLKNKLSRMLAMEKVRWLK